MLAPESFDWFAKVAKQIGFSYVASGPLSQELI